MPCWDARDNDHPEVSRLEKQVQEVGKEVEEKQKKLNKVTEMLCDQCRFNERCEYPLATKEIEKWWELAKDYGIVLEDEIANRRTLRRIDKERAEVRWSLDEVENWLIPPEKKEKLRRIYANDPFRDAREHGDYIDASGTCPFDVEEMRRWLHAAA